MTESRSAKEQKGSLSSAQCAQAAKKSINSGRMNVTGYKLAQLVRPCRDTVAAAGVALIAKRIENGITNELMCADKLSKWTGKRSLPARVCLSYGAFQLVCHATTIHNIKAGQTPTAGSFTTF
jgi:hypothetical protein